jgi:hypothetical protein
MYKSPKRVPKPPTFGASAPAEGAPVRGYFHWSLMDNRFRVGMGNFATTTYWSTAA